tara:strand:- start:184 stop:351 length:168 start_codon:yes stop_codon:yes gene_type:complete
MVKVVEIVGFIAINDLSVVDGEAKELKILMFAMIGEKGFLRDSFVIFMPHGKVSR